MGKNGIVSLIYSFSYIISKFHMKFLHSYPVKEFITVTAGYMKCHFFLSLPRDWRFFSENKITFFFFLIIHLNPNSQILICFDTLLFTLHSHRIHRNHRNENCARRKVASRSKCRFIKKTIKNRKTKPL